MKEVATLIILIFLWCGGGKQEKTQQPIPPPKEEMPTIVTKSVLMVIAPKDFRDEEFKEPYDLLTKSGIKVTIASTDTTPAKGTLGMIVKPQITLEQVVPDSFDAIIIIGGIGCQVLLNNTILHRLVQGFNNTKKTVAAICIAPIVFARAGILKDIKATVYPTSKNELTKYGAQYTGADVEVSGNIITCSGPHAAKDFATKIFKTLSK